MSSIFPIRETVSLENEREPRLVELDEETADEVFEALASRTTREIFLALHKQPQTASDLAEVTDTSVQNVQYHIEKLTDAELVEVVDTWYSERGSEMKVYAPEDESLVLFAGRDKQSTFRSLLNRIVGLLSFLVPPSVLVGWLANRSGSNGIEDAGFEAGGSGDGDSGSPSGSDGADTADPTEQSQDGGDDTFVTQNTDGTPTPEDEAMGTATPHATPDGGETPTPSQTPSISQTDTPEPAATDTPTAAETETPMAEPTETPLPTPKNETANETLSNAAEPTPQIPAEAADSAAEIAGLDPGIAAGMAFFLGGLFVYAVLSYRSTRF